MNISYWQNERFTLSANNMLHNATFLILILLLINCSSVGENHNHLKKYNENLRSGVAISFHREYEPNEKAFSFLLPEGWKISGGITRINPNSYNELANSIGPKLYMKLVSPDEKTSIGWLPDNRFFDKQPFTTRDLIGTIHPACSDYTDIEVKAIMSPEKYLIQVALPFAHPHAQNIKLINTLPLKNLTKNHLQFSSKLSSPNTSEYSAAIITLLYIENGVSFFEKMVCIIEDDGSTGGGLWGNTETWYVRTESAKFNEMAHVLAKISESIQLNREWLEKEIRNQQNYSQILQKDQTWSEAFIKEIVEDNTRSRNEIIKKMFFSTLQQ
jgi:hypothetical protein